MGPKKKVVRNSYYFFMVEYKQKEEAKGRIFPNGLKDVAVAADPEWKKLNPEERKRYETMAKQWKVDQRQTADKYTTLGTRYQAVDEKLRREEEEKKIMDQTIETEIASLQSKRALMEKKFYVIHVNYYCQLDAGNGVFIPAEISVVEFSLGSGVIREYHTFVKASIPSGYRYAAMSHSDETHEIPVDFDKGEKNPLKILHDIKSFLMQGQKSRVVPPLYTMPDNRNLNNSYEAVKSTLKCLCEASVAEEDDGIFRVFQLGKLLFELQRACRAYDPRASTIPEPLQTLAEADLEMDHFNYCRGIACEFHENIDRTLYCSLSIVKRWVYIMCDHCCQSLNIPLILGKHCPVHAVLPQGRDLPSHNVQSEVTDRSENRWSGDGTCEDEDENSEVPGTQSDFGSYVDSVRSQTVENPSNRPYLSSGRNIPVESSQQQLGWTFSDDDFPAIGQISLSESRNQSRISLDRNLTSRGGALSDTEFPAIGRGRSNLRGVGRGRGMFLRN